MIGGSIRTAAGYPCNFSARHSVCFGKKHDRESIIPKTQTKKARRDSFLEKTHRSERLPDLLQYFKEVEGQKTEAGIKK